MCIAPSTLLSYFVPLPTILYYLVKCSARECSRLFCVTVRGASSVGQAKRSEGWEVGQHEQLIEDITQAHKEWKLALEQFNNASQEDVIDDAIYLLIAAERRYEGLIRVARRQHLYVDLQGRITVTHRNIPTALPNSETSSM